ncbi:unnamed protein product [Chilo suppressalis]|uniref:SANT domain-containing protein n=1 Tax=Chilo suppressalis TaxID=168631 RepID=A0ABN8BCG4_CHISP|nr:unnamed protein product [Chilo suppressalis]
MDDDNTYYESNPIENVKHVEGWTKQDKYELLQVLKVYGSHNIEAIHAMLPSKPTNEIIEMINYYRGKALNHLNEKKKDGKVVKSISKVPLSIWAKILTDSYNYNELQTETANAVRVIADCEKFPPATNTNQIDFKAIYHAVANAMEGKALPDDPLINSILQKCIIETAYSSRTFIRNSTLRNVINSINLFEKVGNTFMRPTENSELLALRHLASQRNYNPLSIDEEYLKPSLYTITE